MGPHAVKKALGFTMDYDANGNLIRRSGSTLSVIAWTGFDKPRYLTNGSNGSEFHYDARRSRVLQLTYASVDSNGKPSAYAGKKYYALGASMEADYSITGGSDRMATMRVYIATPDGVGGAVEWDQASGTKKTYVYHMDHLGSVESITPYESVDSSFAKDKENAPSQFSYAPWGERRNPTTYSLTLGATSKGGAAGLTPRGYTGHEMLDNVGLVHMNGRIYDPVLGRFLSADIMVQFPGDLQSYNRYSYVRNNPLTATDPSGFAETEQEKRDREERERKQREEEEEEWARQRHADAEAFHKSLEGGSPLMDRLHQYSVDARSDEGRVDPERAPDNANGNTRWISGPNAGPYHPANGVVKTTGNVTVRITVVRKVGKTGDPLPGGSTGTLLSGTGGVTRVVPTQIIVSATPMAGHANTFQMSCVVDYIAYVTYNGDPERYAQFAEYEHYAVYANGLDTLVNDLSARFDGPKFGLQAGLEERFNRTAQCVANPWYNQRTNETVAIDAPGGSHRLNGPPIIVPEDFPQF